MKLFLLTSLIAFSFVAQKGCEKGIQNSDTAKCYKGRLEVKALCMNYTIKVLDGNMDTSMMEPSWTDETTGITHQNVFRLESVCSFPADIKEGDEFYFTIDNSRGKKDCAVCMAYYPTPKKGLPITVTMQPCK